MDRTRLIHSAALLRRCAAIVGINLGGMRSFDDLPRVLTTHTARSLGVSPAAVRHRTSIGQWTVMAHGYALTRPGPPTRDDWAMVGLLAAGPAAALSGWDAIRLTGIGPGRPTSPDVLVLTQGGHHRRIGRVCIRPTTRRYDTWLLPSDHETLPWAQVVEHARAVADTALGMASIDEVRAVLTASVQRRACAPSDLTAQLAEMPRAGSAWFRRAVAEVLEGARSVAEVHASNRLRAGRVAAYELNVPVVSADGVEVAVLDVLWRALRAVIEIDSRRYHWDQEDAYEGTLARHNRLNRVGFLVEHHSPTAIAAAGTLWATGVDTWLRSRARDMGIRYEPGRGPIPQGPDGPPPVRLTITAAEWNRLAPPGPVPTGRLSRARR